MKRNMALSLGAVALITVIGAGSTFAYLTDTTGTVKNTFCVGKVAFDMCSGLKESKVVRDKKTGNYVDNDGKDNWTSDGEKYTKLYAGETVLKDPTVHLAKDSMDAWVFAKIDNKNQTLTVNYAADWYDVTHQFAVANGYTEPLDYSVYAYKDKLKADGYSTIFESVTVSKDVTNKTTFEPITIKACAVQTGGFASATDAVVAATFK